MDVAPLKDNLRSVIFTDALRDKLARGVEVIAAIRAKGVKAVRTDYLQDRPVIEIDPATAAGLDDIPVSTMTKADGNGMRRCSKVIHGVEIVWSVAA